MDSKLKIPQSSGRAQEKPKVVQRYLLETEDGELTSVPADRLESWQKAQKNGEASDNAVRQLAEDFARNPRKYLGLTDEN